MNRKDRRARQKHGGAQLISYADRLFAVAHEHGGSVGRCWEHIPRGPFDPTHADALNGLGILTHQCGHTDVGIDLIGQAIATNNRVARYHYNIGLLYAAIGRLDKAAVHNRRAVPLEPDFLGAHTNLAAALLADGKRAWARRQRNRRSQAHLCVLPYCAPVDSQNSGDSDPIERVMWNTGLAQRSFHSSRW
jgi:tetratricopeptide (TPR) repeat protein